MHVDSSPDTFPLCENLLSMRCNITYVREVTVKPDNCSLIAAKRLEPGDKGLRSRSFEASALWLQGADLRGWQPPDTSLA